MNTAYITHGHAETFGHQPMDVVTNGELRAIVCARCVTWTPDFHHVAWPCTSAIVLGLVPRPAHDVA